MRYFLLPLLEKLAGNEVQLKCFAYRIFDDENISLNPQRRNNIPLNVLLAAGINFSSIIRHGDPRFPKNLLGANVCCPYRMPVTLIPNVAMNQGPRVRDLTEDRRNR